MRLWMPVLLLTLSLALPAASAGAPTATDAGMLFGGQGGSVANGSTSTTTLDAMPPVLEDYTATWCENCVYVEHALHDLLEERDGHVFSFHRSIGEAEDPFGTQVLDERWEERYSRRAPPTVVFNGSTMVVGSVPEGASLLEDFRALANVSLNLPEGSSTFTWTAATSGQSTVSWALSVQGGPLASMSNVQVSVDVWVVEDTAHFPDGSNGEEHYPHIVRDIITLDTQGWDADGVTSTGTMDISLPAAFDGDDLSLYLVYSAASESVVDPEPEPEPPAGLPGPGAMLSVLALALAARREC